MVKNALALLAVLFFLGLCPALAAARTDYVTIGTGGVTGVYYPTGSAIAKIVNKKHELYNLRVTVEATRGSVYNVNAIASGDLEFGLVQSDRQFQAYQGLADWEGRPVKSLRAVFSLYPETVTIVANAEKNIRSVEDLRGKVVNIGNPGSGQRGNAVDLLTAAGIDLERDLVAREYNISEAVNLLQREDIDAFFYTVGHPNGAIRDAVSGAVKVNFVEIPGSLISKLTQSYPYYTSAEIPVDLYPSVHNERNIASFGVKATLCTSVAVPDNFVYALTKELFSRLEEFKRFHPSYRSLSRENMLEGLSAPIHPGALRFYREIGLK